MAATGVHIDPDGISDLFVVPKRDWDEMQRQLRVIQYALHRSMPPVPLTRRYTLDEVGIRLVQGTDPAYLPEARRVGLSRRTVQRLTGGASGIGADLVAERIAGSVFVTEQAVQDYERHLAHESGRAKEHGGRVRKRAGGNPQKKRATVNR